MAAPPVLDVLWQGQRLAGRVVVPGANDFLYAPAWLRDGYDLSPLVVPFGERAYRNHSAAFDFLPGFLSDCLPDQWGRRILLRDLPGDALAPKPIQMLAWVGRRGLGALGFQPALVAPSHQVWEQIAPALLTREAQAVQQDLPTTAFPHLRQAGTAGGAFPKAVVALTRDGLLLFGGEVAAAALREAQARIGILKLDCEDDPTRPSTDGRMECAYLRMAARAGIEVAKAEVMVEPATAGGRKRHHLLVERFDVQPGQVERLHQVSLAGLREDFNLRYAHLLDTTKRLTANHHELLEAVRRMVFNVRAANADDHGKNHAFLFRAQTRVWSLSPAYDLTLNYASEHRFQGLSVATFGPAPRRNALGEVAFAFGVTEREFDQIDAQVVEAIGQWPECAREAGLPPEQEARARRAHERMQESLDAGSPALKRRGARRRLF